MKIIGIRREDMMDRLIDDREQRRSQSSLMFERKGMNGKMGYDVSNLEDLEE